MPSPTPLPVSNLEAVRQGLATNGERIIATCAAALACEGSGQAAQATLESIQKNLPLLLSELVLLLPEVMAGRTLPSPVPGGGLECKAGHRLDVVVKLLQGTSEAFVMEISRLKESLAEDFLTQACRGVRHFFELKLAAYCLQFVAAQEPELALRTEQLKESAQRLLEAPAKARAASHSREQLLLGVTHELRNTMQCVLLCATALGDEPDNAELPAVAEKLAMSAVHFQKLLDRLHVYAPFLADDGACHLELVDLGDFLKALEHRHRPLARGTQTQLICGLTGGPFKITTDLGKLNLIADNLVGNALHSAHSGWVHIEISDEGAGRVMLKVVDSGRGISLEEGRRMFRVRHHTSGVRFHGLKLGLLASRYLTHLLGGEITFHSEVGRGACFMVVLPTGSQ